MKLVNDTSAGFVVARPPALDAVIARLDQLSRTPEFALQREAALARALRPYVEGEVGRVLAPLPQEVDLATFILYCDVYPEEHLTLIEQLRDVITEHIAEEERAWLDPLKHSYIDLLEVAEPPARRLTLRSLGDGTVFKVPGEDVAESVAPGQVLLTRVIRDPADPESGEAVWAGSGIVLSPADGRALLEKIAEWRREMEMTSGSFALGEWREFAKRFGHMVLWAYAQMRLSALLDAVTHIQYRTPEGQPYLYAIALYDHHESRFLCDGLRDMPELIPASEPVTGADHPVRAWVQREAVEGAARPVARLTVTSTQLIVECDSPERLDAMKHRLASTFGFSLHFRGETLTPPGRQVSLDQLAFAQPLTMTVTPEEDRVLLKAFLEKAYLEWSDQPHRALGGQTPRHAAASPAMRAAVARLVDEMERHDPGLWRTGARVFDYNVLRAHVGLDEVVS